MVGIDLRRTKVGQKILIETDCAVYEMEVADPWRGLVFFSGTDPRLRVPTLGRLDFSTHVRNVHDSWPLWIGPDRYLVLTFRNQRFQTGRVCSARIFNKDWHYDVF